MSAVNKFTEFLGKLFQICGFAFNHNLASSDNSLDCREVRAEFFYYPVSDAIDLDRVHSSNADCFLHICYKDIHFLLSLFLLNFAA